MACTISSLAAHSPMKIPFNRTLRSRIGPPISGFAGKLLEVQ